MLTLLFFVAPFLQIPVYYIRSTHVRVFAYYKTPCPQQCCQKKAKKKKKAEQLDRPLKKANFDGINTDSATLFCLLISYVRA